MSHGNECHGANMNRGYWLRSGVPFKPSQQAFLLNRDVEVMGWTLQILFLRELHFRQRVQQMQMAWGEAWRAVLGGTKEVTAAEAE